MLNLLRKFSAWLDYKIWRFELQNRVKRYRKEGKLKDLSKEQIKSNN
jgi:hypothetical protein